MTLYLIQPRTRYGRVPPSLSNLIRGGPMEIGKQLPDAFLAEVADIEAWAFGHGPRDVREKHDASVGELRGTIAVIVMTRIALGDPGFEEAFPEYAHANPNNK